MTQIRRDRLQAITPFANSLYKSKEIACVYARPFPGASTAAYDRYKQEHRFIYNILSGDPFKCLFIIPKGHPQLNLLNQVLPDHDSFRFILHLTKAGKLPEQCDAKRFKRIYNFLSEHARFLFFGDSALLQPVAQELDGLRQKFGLLKKEYRQVEKLSYKLENGCFVRLGDFSNPPNIKPNTFNISNS